MTIAMLGLVLAVMLTEQMIPRDPLKERLVKRNIIRICMPQLMSQ